MTESENLTKITPLSAQKKRELLEAEKEDLILNFEKHYGQKIEKLVAAAINETRRSKVRIEVVELKKAWNMHPYGMEFYSRFGRRIYQHLAAIYLPLGYQMKLESIGSYADFAIVIKLPKLDRKEETSELRDFSERSWWNSFKFY